MNRNDDPGFSGSRRRLLGGSAAVVALAAMPVVSLKAGTTKGAGDKAPVLWLVRHDPVHDRWRPVASAGRGRAVDQALHVLVRGPRVVSGEPNPDLSLEAVYRSLPQRPFQLARGLRAAGQGGSVLHAQPTALAAVQVRQGGQCARCELGGLFSSAVTPGRYAVVIDTDGNRRSPDWRRLSSSADGFPFESAGGRALAAVLLDIRAA